MLYVKNLHKSYEVGKTKYQVLKGIDLHVAKGEFVAVMGPSGSGKTTLLNCISCYIPFDKSETSPGSITLGGTKLAGLRPDALAKIRNTQIGFVFQDFMLLDGLTIRENILVPRIIQGAVEKDAEMLADELVSLFGIKHSKSSRAVIEAFGNAKEKMDATIFMVTHDSFAASFCDRVILLKDGTVYKQLERKGEHGAFQDELLGFIKAMNQEVAS